MANSTIFTKNGGCITIINTNNTTTDGFKIYRYAIWDSKGRQTDAGEIEASNIKEATIIMQERTF